MLRIIGIMFGLVLMVVGLVMMIVSCAVGYAATGMLLSVIGIITGFINFDRYAGRTND